MAVGSAADQDIRATALAAAATVWAGITVTKNRDAGIVETARIFAEYIATGARGQLEPETTTPLPT